MSADPGILMWFSILFFYYFEIPTVYNWQSVTVQVLMESSCLKELLHFNSNTDIKMSSLLNR